MKTAQQAYDMLYEAAYDGTFPSYDPNEAMCMYRQDKTKSSKKRCAAGIFLPDENWSLSLERRNIVDLDFSLFEEIEGIGQSYLVEFQRAHDRHVKEHHVWNPTSFIDEINSLRCFDSVKKRKPK